MRALLLSPEPPFPLTGGGALRTASLLTWMAQHYTVDVALFAVHGASDPAEALPPGLVDRVIKLPLPSHSKSMPARVMRNGLRLLRGVPPLLDRFSGRETQLAAALAGRPYDLTVIEHFWCAPYVDILRPLSRRLILDLHNIESEWHRRLGDAGSPWFRAAHRHFARAYFKRECALLPKFDRVLVSSEREAAGMPTGQTLVYPNAIPTRAVPNQAKDFSIAFSGNLEYAPNQQAVQYFAHDIWPALREQWPKLIWRIIGKNQQAITNLLPPDQRIECTGPVEDAISVLARSQLAITPVLAGSGTRVKILEAWAAQLPVVATTLGAEGLDAEPGTHLLLADTPADFTASIRRVLESPDLALRLSLAGRQLYEKCYTWDAAWQGLDRGIAPR